MSNLVLEIKQGDMMVVNGAAIRFRTKTRIELTSRARFLFGKQLMSPSDATTPARRIYYALQTAYVGSDEERGPALETARALIRMFSETTTSATARLVLARAVEAAMTNRCYVGLKLAKRIMRHEDAVLNGAADADAELADVA